MRSSGRIRQAGDRRRRAAGPHDEEPNIELSNRLQKPARVDGVVGFKTHCKMAMAVRREPDGIRRYRHLGTGNYHPRTARGYTDYGLFTCDRKSARTSTSSSCS